jgi:hypothetical protein
MIPDNPKGELLIASKIARAGPPISNYFPDQVSKEEKFSYAGENNLRFIVSTVTLHLSIATQSSEMSRLLPFGNFRAELGSKFD